MEGSILFRSAMDQLIASLLFFRIPTNYASRSGVKSDAMITRRVLLGPRNAYLSAAKSGFNSSASDDTNDGAVGVLANADNDSYLIV